MLLKNTILKQFPTILQNSVQDLRTRGNVEQANSRITKGIIYLHFTEIPGKGNMAKYR